MDELYSFQSFNSLFSCPNGISSNYVLGDESFSNNISYGLNDHHHHQIQQQQNHNLILTAQVSDSQNNYDHHHHQVVSTGFEMSDIIKSQIANHPLYPNLLSAYVECRKVGAPKELASLLEEISQENHQISAYTEIGSDPELDHFMRSYCEVLLKYKEELLKPFDEATSFLSNIEHQLSNLCKETLSASSTTCSAASGLQDDEDHGHGYLGSEQTINCDELLSGNQEYNFGNNNLYQVDGEIKETLMRKYSGYLSSLKKEFLKKRKKGKLPKDARTALFDWWNTHYRWPYPTEEEKNRLSKITGLDPKQINNWFINQRKRHWRPSEDMGFAIMEGVSGGHNISASSSYLDDNINI